LAAFWPLNPNYLGAIRTVNLALRLQWFESTPAQASPRAILVALSCCFCCSFRPNEPLGPLLVHNWPHLQTALAALQVACQPFLQEGNELKKRNWFSGTRKCSQRLKRAIVCICKMLINRALRMLDFLLLHLLLRPSKCPLSMTLRTAIVRSRECPELTPVRLGHELR